MARRPIEKELIETLTENELDFIPRGIYHIKEIYDFIKNEYLVSNMHLPFYSLH